MAATKPVTPLPVVAAHSSRSAASGVMPTASTGSSLPRLRIEHANFDDVVMQHVLRAVQDVRFQQLDPLVDRHLGHFVGRQVGQLDARLVDGGELLLLHDFVGHLANRDDQVLRRAVLIEHRARRAPACSGSGNSEASNALARPVVSAVWNGQKSGPRISGVPITS